MTWCSEPTFLFVTFWSKAMCIASLLTFLFCGSLPHESSVFQCILTLPGQVIVQDIHDPAVQYSDQSCNLKHSFSGPLPCTCLIGWVCVSWTCGAVCIWSQLLAITISWSQPGYHKTSSSAFSSQPDATTTHQEHSLAIIIPVPVPIQQRKAIAISRAAGDHIIIGGKQSHPPAWISENIVICFPVTAEWIFI
jgi:hypothetical protein